MTSTAPAEPEAEQYRLVGDVRTANPEAVRAALSDLLPGATIDANAQGFAVDARLNGESAKELNRWLLSALRRVERRTTLRSEWTSAGTVDRFFDYVHKGSRPV